jgi:hypothetical protein
MIDGWRTRSPAVPAMAAKPRRNGICHDLYVATSNFVLTAEGRYLAWKFAFRSTTWYLHGPPKFSLIALEKRPDSRIKRRNAGESAAIYRKLYLLAISNKLGILYRRRSLGLSHAKMRCVVLGRRKIWLLSRITGISGPHNYSRLIEQRYFYRIWHCIDAGSRAGSAVGPRRLRAGIRRHPRLRHNPSDAGAAGAHSAAIAPRP